MIMRGKRVQVSLKMYTTVNRKKKNPRRRHLVAYADGKRLDLQLQKRCLMLLFLLDSVVNGGPHLLRILVDVICVDKYDIPRI